MSTTHRAGFVHVVGKPNAGKSTLFNALIGHPLSIATHKPQTTRQNIVGLDNGEHFQIVYVDTPGYIDPKNPLQESMMRQVRRAMADSEVVLWLHDIRDIDTPEGVLRPAILEKYPGVVLCVLNKTDLIEPAALPPLIVRWGEEVHKELVAISALHRHNLEVLKEKILHYLPDHPPYYDKEELTDRPARFFAAEIIRKAILVNYQQEVPYSAEVVIDSFREDTQRIVVYATIYVERLSQKKIMIGAGGRALKKLGIAARKELENFFKKKVFLAHHIEILPQWRHNDKQLKKWGYQ